MIVFGYSPHGITVIRTFSASAKPLRTMRPEGIGRLRLSDKWLWDRNRISLETYRTIDHSEKRQIIGMLDALNQQPIRPITGMKARWEEIIGPIAVDYLATHN